MNLKEAFRYQSFINDMMTKAFSSLVEPSHALRTTKTHLRHEANPEVDDVVEEVDRGDFYNNDNVIKFMLDLIEEKRKLSDAVLEAKNRGDFNIDSAIEVNKLRQVAASAIKKMMRFSPSKRLDRGCAYKFNVEGNQTAYYYDIDVESVEDYDRAAAKELYKNIMRESDKVSEEIDMTMVNTKVDYDPPFDVNESFEDIMSSYI